MNRNARRAAQKQGRGTSGANVGSFSASADRFAAAVNHFRAGQITEAEHACRDALMFDPDHADSLHLLGVIAFRCGRNEAAAELLGKAVARNARSAEFRYNLGLACAALGRSGEAAAHFAEAASLQPNFADAYICLGNLLKERGDLESAAMQYRRALALRPDDAMALYNLGNVLAAQGRVDDAVTQFRRALALAPNSADILSNLAIALEKQEKFDEARALHERAIACQPDNAELYNNFGTMCWRQGKNDEAIALYQRALALNPTNIDAYNNLGTVLAKLSNHADAFTCFERALTLAPDHSATQLVICAIVYQLSHTDREKAVEQAKRLLATYGDKPLMRRGLAGLIDEGIDEAGDGDYTREVFDHFAANFDKTLAELGYEPGAIAKVLRLGEDGRGPVLEVLDIGCGTGLGGPYLRPVARTLTGVDLSPRMLDKARALSVYDRLVSADATAFMRENPEAFDLVVAADVLPYLGDLSALLEAARRTLRGGGQLAVTAESLDAQMAHEGYRIAASGRYKHSRAYLEKVFGEAGFEPIRIIEHSIRREAGQPVGGWILVGRKRQATATPS